MDPKLVQGLLGSLIPANYARQGCEALAKRQKLVTSLLSERRLPQHGWNAASIEQLLQAGRRYKSKLMHSDFILPAPPNHTSATPRIMA